MKSRCKICRQPATRKRGLASLCDAIECEAELGKPAPVKRKVHKTMKSKGMKGRSPNAFEKQWHDALASLGCIACYQDGIHQPIVSIHHIDGRTKPNAHIFCLPLCAGHHQDGTGNDKQMIAVHPWKSRFEARYGTQMQLLEVCTTLLLGKFDIEKIHDLAHIANRAND